MEYKMNTNIFKKILIYTVNTDYGFHCLYQQTGCINII